MKNLILLFLLFTNSCYGYQFESCSLADQDNINAAINESKIETNAVINLNEPTFFIKWFGFNDMNDIKDKYKKIYTELTNSNLTFNCSCAYEIIGFHENDYAYVDPDKYHIINLCKLFMTENSKQYDTRAGVIIHETSHFNNVIGTKDILTNYMDCLAFAKVKIGQKLVFNNANSYEYMVEDYNLYLQKIPLIFKTN